MTVCLLLAAGSSSRMGKPKMLLPFNNKTLLQHVIDEVKKTNGVELLVVTGCYHALLKGILLQQQIPFVENTNWEEGMGSSIQKGITYIMENFSNATGVLILVCDQPYISSSLLNELIISAEQKGKGIAASAYSNTTGTPVLFNKKYFKQLALLSGQYGAKRLIHHFADDVITVQFPKGEVDIDTPRDYDKLNQ